MVIYSKADTNQGNVLPERHQQFSERSDHLEISLSVTSPRAPAFIVREEESCDLMFPWGSNMNSTSSGTVKNREGRGEPWPT